MKTIRYLKYYLTLYFVRFKVCSLVYVYLQSRETSSKVFLTTGWCEQDISADIVRKHCNDSEKKAG